MAKHRTVYTYSKDGKRCRIEHAISADAVHGHSDATSNFHQALVERAQPKRTGLWQMANSGSAGGGVDSGGMEATYFAEWVQVDGGVRATINHNDQDGERVGLVLTRDERGYGWHTASGEDCGLGGFESVEAADDAAQQLRNVTLDSISRFDALGAALVWKTLTFILGQGILLSLFSQLKDDPAAFIGNIAIILSTLAFAALSIYSLSSDYCSMEKLRFEITKRIWHEISLQENNEVK